MMSAVFQLHDLSFTYPGQDAPALSHIDLEIHTGEFLVLCGSSGCGKSTLLRQLKPALAPKGSRTGAILFAGRPLETLSQQEQAGQIGFVLQSPESQVVTDKVWHELAFGLESLGCDIPTIRRRVAEMASFFGIQGWFYQDVAQLSGGQKQLLSLASVMAMQPRVLILDEPTGQLDPIAASDFLATLGKLNRELGITVILSEHRLEEALPLADRAVVMEGGRILFDGAPQAAGEALQAQCHPMFLAMPTPMQVWAAAPHRTAQCPVTVRDGRDWLAAYHAEHPLGELPPEILPPVSQETVIQADGLWFRYEKDGEDIVKGFSFTACQGEFIALLGGNGTGKTTALKLLAGLLEPHRGILKRQGTIGLLPQDPLALFAKKTVGEELSDGGQDGEGLDNVVALCRLESLLDRHPYDLSGGEQQRAALAKVLLQRPEILLLDEPTKGLDAQFKQELAALLDSLAKQGTTLVMVSHDVEFCARYAHRCDLFFDGGVVTSAPPRAFFSGNSFYTTAANRMARELLPAAVTAGDVAAACGGRLPAAAEAGERPARAVAVPPAPDPSRRKALPRWRKIVALVSAGTALVILLHFLGLFDLMGLFTALSFSGVWLARRQLLLYGAFSAALILLALALERPSPEKPAPRPRRKLPRRTVLATVLILLLIPLTLFFGVTFLESRKYYVTALLILAECMIPFFLVFEGRKPQARELVLIAVLCALGVAGRALFFMLPEFKPVMALVIVSGAAFGGETGFLVGSVTMLLSNMLLSQGPWTPWQMFAMGMVGFLAGLLFHSGLLRGRRIMCLFGALAAIVVYGGIMNFQSALTWSHRLNWGILLSYYAAGFPMDCIHAAATWVFLWFGGGAMLEKLERVKGKYDLGG